MIFTVQRFLEDYFERSGLTDADQYAIRVANVFDRVGSEADQKDLIRDLARVQTVFFRRNRRVGRRDFEAQLAATLLGRFKKKDRNDRAVESLDGALAAASARLSGRRRSIATLLSEFKLAVESRAIDAFWSSRKRNLLRPKPEKIAQALLAVFAKGALGSNGLILREISSGIGFVDVGISFANVLHLIELKIVKSKQLSGPSQLATYMKTEGRRKGWLVLIDSREDRESVIPPRIVTPAGLIATVIVEVNPTPPNLS